MKTPQKKGHRHQKLHFHTVKDHKEKKIRRRSKGIGEKFLLGLLAVFLVSLLVYFLVR